MKSRFTIILIGLFLPTLVLSQSVKSIRINEIQVHNADGFRDEYGRASGWIELYNTGYGKVNLAGCTLKVKGKEYRIPSGDPATVIATRGYMVFFAGGTPDKGTFHTNFTLDDTDFIEFYDSDGNFINRFEFNPADMVEASYGWFEDLSGTEKLMQLPATTPGGNNNTVVKEHRSEQFKRQDPIGIVLTLICIVFVTITLTLFYFFFKYMGNYYVRATVKKSKKTAVASVSSGVMKDTGGKKDRLITNDELAAVAIALYKYSERLHDAENLVLTINKASKVYSPWSSKIYSLRQLPNKK